MKRMSHVFGLVLTLVAVTLRADNDPFRRGVQAYLAADFPQASLYFAQATALEPSAGGFHNLGNAEWYCGHAGPAILAWERALGLDPFNKNTRANLRFARKTAELEAINFTWFEICSTWLPVNAWAWLASFSFWLAVAMLLLPAVFHWRRADWRQACSAAGFAVFLLMVPGLVGVHSRAQIGVIQNPQTPLRLTPTQTAQTMTRLAPGTMARRERTRGKYVYVRLSNDTAGWVQQTDFGLIHE
jgi:hypothetical protein